MEDTYQIKLPVFEGPFDLLLFFIERDELEIHEVAIAQITDDFLDYIRQMNELNIELASEFIFVASSLMQIKARTLLPRVENKEAMESDLRLDLVQMLIEYKRFKSVSEELRQKEEARMLQERRGNVISDLALIAQHSEPGEELTTLDLFKLMTVYHKVMQRYADQKEDVTHTVVQYPYTIEEQKKTIARLLEINKTLDFAIICKNSENKVHFVYNFLAILEMLQQEILSIQLHLGFNNFVVIPRQISSSN